jgi:single-strand DNA-binding protein
MTYQSITIVGNLGRDPEMRYTPSGQPVTNFNVATNRQYKAKDGTDVKETTWFRVTTWARTAEVCNQYLKQGSQVLVEGRLTPDPTTGGPKVYGRGDGTMGASFELNASNVRFLSGSVGGGGATPPDPNATQTAPPKDEDIPF